MRHERFHTLWKPLTYLGNCAAEKLSAIGSHNFGMWATDLWAVARGKAVGTMAIGYRMSIPCNSWLLQMDVNDRMVSNGFRENLYLDVLSGIVTL